MFWYKCCAGNELKDKANLYDIAKIVLDDYLDISYIIQKLEEFEKLKLICLTFEQSTLFNYIANDLCTLDEFKQNELKYNKFKEFMKDKEKIADIISKFINKVANDDEGLSEVDKNIYDLLKDDLKF